MGFGSVVRDHELRYGAEKDNLIKSYFNFLNMLYHPSKIERKIMDEWCKVNTLKNPLKA